MQIDDGCGSSADKQLMVPGRKSKAEYSLQMLCRESKVPSCRVIDNDSRILGYMSLCKQLAAITYSVVIRYGSSARHAGLQAHIRCCSYFGSLDGGHIGHVK